jgi:hypothetical protein
MGNATSITNVDYSHAGTTYSYSCLRSVRLDCGRFGGALVMVGCLRLTSDVCCVSQRPVCLGVRCVAHFSALACCVHSFSVSAIAGQPVTRKSVQCLVAPGCGQQLVFSVGRSCVVHACL